MVPALLTSTSMRPKWRVTTSTISLTCARSVTSQGKA
jgi:hypothetical protein